MDIVLERILSLVPKKENGEFAHGALKEFAQSIGLKNGNLISNWISGRSNSYLKKLHEISAVYGVSVEWLKCETDERSPPPKDGDGLDEKTLEAANLFAHAEPWLQDQVLALLRAAESSREVRGASPKGK